MGCAVASSGDIARIKGSCSLFSSCNLRRMYFCLSVSGEEFMRQFYHWACPLSGHKAVLHTRLWLSLAYLTFCSSVYSCRKVHSLSLLSFGTFLPVVGLVGVAFLSLDFAHRARPYNCEFSWSVNRHRCDADSMLCALCSGRACVVQLNHCPLLSLRTIHHRYFRSLSGRRLHFVLIILARKERQNESV